MSTSDAERLDEELRFLLESLDDLDREHAAGGLSEQRYEQLHARYTARAADVARAADRARATPRAGTGTPAGDGTRGRPERFRPAGTRRRRRLVTTAAVLALAGLGTTATLTLLGDPGTSDRAGTGPGTVATLQRAVQQNPRNPAVHDALADALAQTGDLTGALREFDTAVSLDPTDAVALAYSGWIALLAGAPDKALPRLDRAEAVDPAFPDAHAFRGIALLRADGDRAQARSELQRYLELAPGGPMTQQVRDVLTQLGQEP